MQWWDQVLETWSLFPALTQIPGVNLQMLISTLYCLMPNFFPKQMFPVLSASLTEEWFVTELGRTCFPPRPSFSPVMGGPELHSQSAQGPQVVNEHTQHCKAAQMLLELSHPLSVTEHPRHDYKDCNNHHFGGQGQLFIHQSLPRLWPHWGFSPCCAFLKIWTAQMKAASMPGASTRANGS